MNESDSSDSAVSPLAQLIRLTFNHIYCMGVCVYLCWCSRLSAKVHDQIVNSLHYILFLFRLSEYVAIYYTQSLSFRQFIFSSTLNTPNANNTKLLYVICLFCLAWALEMLLFLPFSFRAPECVFVRVFIEQLRNDIFRIYFSYQGRCCGDV